MRLVIYLIVGWFMLSLGILVICLVVYLRSEPRSELEAFKAKLLRQICEDLQAQGFDLDPHEVLLGIDEHNVQITIVLSEGDELELPLQLRSVPNRPGVTVWVIKES